MRKFCFPLIVVLASCIQIPIGNTPVKNYDKVDYQTPNAPFESLNAEVSDGSWLHRPSGNIISFRSECPTQVSTLKNHLRNMTAQFNRAQKLKEETIKYNARKALVYNFKADLEGISTTFQTVSFKKYGCFFIITHNGKEEKISQTETQFQTFLENFKVYK